MILYEIGKNINTDKQIKTRSQAESGLKSLTAV